ncbi:LuxR C-terminal-related transcriptional regulator [Agaribacter flavus]|uniref:LuxR C-terminal-related transcriptional regulator n=1 Tax=Agaribacter flavus TaxID=1902781 RepID=A0ABV7FR84_9ALTE
MLKFLIADDHPLYREALKAALKTEFDRVTYLESDSFNSTINVIRNNRRLNLLLLDLNMPGCDNFYGLLRIKQTYPDLPIAVVSATDSIDVISQVLEFGADAFIPKTTPTSDLIVALKTVLDGDKWLPAHIEKELVEVNSDTLEIAHQVKELTPKQFQVLRFIKQGLMNKHIADELNVTEATVKAHISMIFKRLNVKSRTQILVAIEKLQLD